MAGAYFIMGVGYADLWHADLFIGVSHGFNKGTMGGPFNPLFHKVTSHYSFPVFVVILVNTCLPCQNALISCTFSGCLAV
jgi:hypothetical protein